jgi:hypothetical protein
MFRFFQLSEHFSFPNAPLVTPACPEWLSACADRRNAQL